MITKIIDVSRYQGKPDFERAKLSGVQGVMLRAVSTRKSEGGIYIDPTFERNYAECKRVGLPVGVYYYTYARDKATVAAELAKLREAISGKSFELPVAVDVEDNALRPLSRAALTDLVELAAKTIESWKAYCMVYTYTNYKNTELDMDKLSAHDLWIADYRGVRPGFAHGMWQYTSKGAVLGINGNVDINHCYRDYPGIIARAGLNDFTRMGVGELKKYVTGPVSKGDAAELIAWAKEKAVTCEEVAE